MASTHVLQMFLGGDATIHDPDPVCPAIALFDRVQEVLKCLAVSRVARQHLLGQWKTLNRHHQRTHHLHTSGAMIPTITEATLVFFRAGRTALEIRARQVLEQYLELHPEQVQRPRRCPKSASLCASTLSRQRYKVSLAPIAKSSPKRSPIALCSNQCRCKRHSLPGSIRR